MTRFLLALVSLALVASCVAALCPNMQSHNSDDPQQNEWSCLPCGGSFSCKVQANSNDVCSASSIPGCVLPLGATTWTCCRNCDARGPGACPYAALTSSDIDDDESDDRWCRTDCIAIISVVGLMVISTAAVLTLATLYKVLRKRQDGDDEEDIPFAASKSSSTV